MYVFWKLMFLTKTVILSYLILMYVYFQSLNANIYPSAPFKPEVFPKHQICSKQIQTLQRLGICKKQTEIKILDIAFVTIS